MVATNPLALRFPRPSIPTEVPAQKADAPAQQQPVQDNFCGTVAPGAKKPKKFKDNDWTTLSGSIMIMERTVGIGGETPPAGFFLMLDKPITLNGKKVSMVRVPSEGLRRGEKVTLHGRLNERKWGGVETKGGKYVELSGVSNVSKGEPKFDGKGHFLNAKGEVLERLSYNRPLIMDAPAQIFVIDGDKAWLGSMGGFIPPWMNSFHGFSGSAKVVDATDADRDAVKTDGDKLVNAKSGKALEKISFDQDTGPSFPDKMSSDWYFDEETNKAYKVLNGGIAGFRNFVTQVIAL